MTAVDTRDEIDLRNSGLIQRGRNLERDIVAVWLRLKGAESSDNATMLKLWDLADGIERGEHRVSK